MDMAYQSALASDPILITGPAGRKFFAHSALLAGQSKILDKAINGNMREAKERAITIYDIDDDIDEDTIAHFIQYIYTSDYVVESDTDDPNPCSSLGCCPPVKSRNTGDTDSHDTAFFVDKRELHGDANKSHYVQPLPGTLEQLKKRLQMDFDSQVEASGPLVKPRRPYIKDSEDVTAADLLSHARLYVFSNRYDCSALANLALQKLTYYLTSIKPKLCRDALIELVNYTYRHTPQHDMGFDKLRLLITNYSICNLECFRGDNDFERLLIKKGEYARDIIVEIINGAY